jgi:hypothetical protein
MDNFTAGQIVKIVASDQADLIGKKGLVLSKISARGEPLIYVSDSFSPYSYRGYRPEQLELAEKTDISKKGYSLEEDLAPYLCGIYGLPNFEEITDTRAGISAIAAGGGMVGIPDICNTKIMGEQYTSWSRIWLCRGQSGQFTGEGYAMIYRTAKYGRDEDGKGTAEGQGIIGRFAICKHTKVAGAGANPTRGWHPGACSKCGLDMTVDSGD